MARARTYPRKVVSPQQATLPTHQRGAEAHRRFQATGHPRLRGSMHAGKVARAHEALPAQGRCQGQGREARATTNPGPQQSACFCSRAPTRRAASLNPGGRHNNRHSSGSDRQHRHHRHHRHHHCHHRGRRHRGRIWCRERAEKPAVAGT